MTRSRYGNFTLYRRLARHTRSSWPSIAALVAVGVLVTPLALLTPLPLKTASTAFWPNSTTRSSALDGASSDNGLPGARADHRLPSAPAASSKSMQPWATSAGTEPPFMSKSASVSARP
jgi:hypothetical protein